eukprot:gene1091-biopygen962
MDPWIVEHKPELTASRPRASAAPKKIVSKSISKDGGITTYRGLVRVDEGAYGCKSHVQCDALILDELFVDPADRLIH